MQLRFHSQVFLRKLTSPLNLELLVKFLSGHERVECLKFSQLSEL